MNGVIMQRVLGLAIAMFAFSSLSGVPDVAHTGAPIEESSSDQPDQRSAPIDVAALLTAARGAPPIICSLASRAISGYGWGGRADAPSTPLGSFGSETSYDFERQAFPTEDVQKLLAGLASDDACVREMSVRLIGTQKPAIVASELITRLGSSDPGLRAVSAFGLGLVDAPTAVDPLIR